MRFRMPRPRSPRRGVTLIEMLVTVTLLVLMMTALVQIFSAATGAVSAARSYQELDGSLRQLDSMIRTDLQGVTARMTPPLNPEDNLGYFEYGENQFADLQGEDSDDYVRFTARAPAGQFFTGRIYLSPPSALVPLTTAQQTLYLGQQPITITSEAAEIIYFLRNGNLYRRVFLIAPERQSQVGGAAAITSTLYGYNGTPLNTASWLGMNDVSARPGNYANNYIPRLNTLGDLTNRENRAFYPRFNDDYLTIGGSPVAPDGIPDEFNGDGVPDWYTTMYPKVFSTGLISGTNPTSASTADLLSFPYVFPNAYSVPDHPVSSSNIGSIHGMPQNGSPAGSTTFPDSPPYGYLHLIGDIPGRLIANYPSPTAPPNVTRPNHNPVEIGDSLNDPASAGYQTWWGFPTWKETIAPFYNDPYWTLVSPLSGPSYAQANGLSYSSSYSFSLTSYPNSTTQLLPPMTGAASTLGYQPFNDGKGLLPSTAFDSTTSFVTIPAVFEDDLVMTGVRSFDIKAYDDTAPGYVDLGYSNFVSGITTGFTDGSSATNPTLTQVVTSVLQGFGHEGRIPPLTADYRLDPQFPILPGGNVGDTNTGVVRLRRVFDTWSTDYTQAPMFGIDKFGNVLGGGPYNPGARPLYPSYPPPYAPLNFVAKKTDEQHTDKGIPLRGIQIQIRVVDPRSEHIKVLTIRQDFTDKL